MFHNNESDPVIFEERRWGEDPGWTERPLSGSGNGSRSGAVIVAPKYSADNRPVKELLREFDDV